MWGTPYYLRTRGAINRFNNITNCRFGGGGWREMKYLAYARNLLYIYFKWRILHPYRFLTRRTTARRRRCKINFRPRPGPRRDARTSRSPWTPRTPGPTTEIRACYNNNNKQTIIIVYSVTTTTTTTVL